ncbi:hypothetical protein HN954_03335 [bacterium]|jgi:hypothetical protein|nr:hypothetical protein [bacterium]MBT6832342.1 hypothetical protein [bacterium]MBT6996437.1 hypothetical protein [bacterium]MBT7772748.1 hypothetical protein [bacterium]
MTKLTREIIAWIVVFLIGAPGVLGLFTAFLWIMMVIGAIGSGEVPHEIPFSQAFKDIGMSLLLAVISAVPVFFAAYLAEDEKIQKMLLRLKRRRRR